MKAKRWLLGLVPVLCVSALRAEELAPVTVAKILKLVLTDARESSIACTDPMLKLELEKLGVAVSPESRIVWVRSSQEKSKFRGSHRLTISGQVSDLNEGVVVALVGEGGHGVFYISRSNVAENKIMLSNAIARLGKVI
jgi:hypothetical protein